MLSKITNFIKLSLLSIFLSACSVPATYVFIDNSTCSESIAEGAFKIMLDDLDKKVLTKKEKEGELNARKLLGLMLSSKKELNNFFLNANGTKYSFLFQQEEQECFLRLYKKESQGSSYNNTITFIDSFKLNLCKCSSNSVQLGM